MGRVNPREFEKYGNQNGADWLRLANDGDVARVQFMYNNYDELDTYVCHKVKVGDNERYVDCKRNYDDPLDACPFCEAGLPVKPVMILTMYDLNEKKVKIWERGKTFLKRMEALFNRYPDLINHVFEIERHGAKGDTKTTYDIYPMPDVEPMDLSNVEKPQFMGSFILDKSPDEMVEYLDTGSFPQTENNQQQEESGVRRRASRREESQPTRTSRRGGF